MTAVLRWPAPAAVRRGARLAGPLVAVIVYAALPQQYAAGDLGDVPFSHAGRVTVAVAVWMAIWWLTEAIEIPATALIPWWCCRWLASARCGRSPRPTRTS